MARPGLIQHRKFKRLSRVIGDAALALGSLELIWSSAYEHGDDYLGEGEDVEAAACWQGDSGKLVAALLSAGGDGNHGFIEEIVDRPGHYLVHNLYDHAPEYVQKRMAREAERISKGLTISSVRREAGKRGRAAQIFAEPPASVGQVEAVCPTPSDKCRANVGQASAKGVTLEPAPAPKEEPKEKEEKICTEPQAASEPPSPEIFIFPSVGNGKKKVGFTQAQLDQWSKDFPGVNIGLEFGKMRAWLEANPTKRKTARGTPAFVVRWLSKAQDAGGKGSAPLPIPGNRGARPSSRPAAIPRQECAVPSCGSPAGASGVLCDYHWGAVPQSARSAWMEGHPEALGALLASADAEVAT